MAIEKIFNTRILNKIDTLENWNKSSLEIKKGEICIATVAASAGTGLTEPVVMFKVATEEGKTFSQLPWAFHAKSSDVLAACKTEEGLTAFINTVIANAGIATDEAMQELAGKVTAAEGKITALEGAVGDANGGLVKGVADNAAAIDVLEGYVGGEAVSKQISDAIEALKLADTYAAKSHKHEITDVNGLSDAIADAKKAGTDADAALSTYKTANDAAVLKNTNDISANTNAIATIKDGTSIDSFADVETELGKKEAAGAAASALTEAKSYADSLAGNYDAKGDADKALESAKAYADGLAGNYDAKGDAAQALTDAKSYVDGEIEEWVGDKNVGTQISEAIANYTTTTDMNAAIKAAKDEATGHADGLNTAMDARVGVVEGKAHVHANKDELALIASGDVAKWNAAEQNAKDYADGLDEAMDERVAAIEAKFGEGEGNVESQIAAAVAAEAKLREDADKALQDQIGIASAEGVTATGLNARIEELESLVGDDKVSEAIADAVAVEKERAEGIEGGLETRLAAVEGDYLKAADKTELEGKIKSNTDAIELLTNGVDTETVDGVNDLIKYVKDHGTEVTGIKGDIKANADDIDALEGRMGTAEGAIATKAAQADLEGLAGRVSTVEGDLNTAETGLKARMTAAELAIAAIDDLVGDDKVSDQITAVTNPMSEKIGTLEGKAHTHTNATVLDGIEATDVAAWDAKIDGVTAAANSGLKATKTGNTVAIEIDDTVTFIFDCGGSGVVAE